MALFGKLLFLLNTVLFVILAYRQTCITTITLVEWLTGRLIPILKNLIVYQENENSYEAKYS